MATSCVPLSQVNAVAAELVRQCQLVGWASHAGVTVQVLPVPSEPFGPEQSKPMGGQVEPEATRRRRARVAAYLEGLRQLASNYPEASAACAVGAVMSWACVMVERDNANALEELGRRLRSSMGSGYVASDAAALWLVVGCVLSALAAASLGLEVESAELAPLALDGPAAWEAWVSAGDDPAADLWREAVRP